MNKNRWITIGLFFILVSFLLAILGSTPQTVPIIHSPISVLPTATLEPVPTCTPVIFNTASAEATNTQAPMPTDMPFVELASGRKKDYSSWRIYEYKDGRQIRYYGTKQEFDIFYPTVQDQLKCFQYAPPYPGGGTVAALHDRDATASALYSPLRVK
jgi:hypothetical protein